jgi:hypothetical protein
MLDVNLKRILTYGQRERNIPLITKYVNEEVAFGRENTRFP